MKITNQIFDYQFGEILDLIKSTKHKVLKSINTELIDLNFQIGKFISENCSSNNWGEKTIEKFIQIYN